MKRRSWIQQKLKDNKEIVRETFLWFLGILIALIVTFLAIQYYS